MGKTDGEQPIVIQCDGWYQKEVQVTKGIKHKKMSTQPSFGMGGEGTEA